MGQYFFVSPVGLALFRGLVSMKRNPQLPVCDTSRGAPMGRPDEGTAPTSKVRLFKVRLDQGYDDGGAYWGVRFIPGLCLYVAVGQGYMRFVDAYGRKDAAYQLGLTRKGQLAAPIRF